MEQDVLNSFWDNESILFEDEAEDITTLLTDFRNPFRGIVLESITKIFQSFHSALRQNEPLSITLLNRRSSDSTNTYSFPGRTSAEAWRFITTVKILDVIHDHVYKDRITTKRDIFYQYAGLFKNQLVVDKIIDDLAATFGVARSALNVVAQKGLVTGNIQLLLNNSAVLDCHKSESGVLIPPACEISEIELNEAKWILVVEKEAVFRSLATDTNFPSSGGIIVTGKGYPDVATRQFLHMIEEQSEVPVFALVDLDPYGLEIFATYRFGSQAMAHEAEGLVVKSLRWLGLKGCHITRLMARTDEDEGKEREGMLFLSHQDRRKAVKLLERKYISDIPELRLELQKILFTGLKAEIELLDCLEGKTMFEWIKDTIAAEP